MLEFTSHGWFADGAVTWLQFHASAQTGIIGALLSSSCATVTLLRKDTRRVRYQKVIMKKVGVSVVFVTTAILAACSKKDQGTPAPADASEPAVTASAPASEPAAPSEPTAQQLELAQRQALMDYATMEDKYITDPKAQWANAARASSTFGDDDGEPSEGSKAKNVMGSVDGDTWTNNHQDVGFDWLEVGFDKPVSATEVRVVFADGKGVEAANKVELQDTDGSWHTVWSGISEVKTDERGRRTWFVRTFEPTPYKTKAAKITIANNVQRGYKEIDAVQLVGE